MKIAKVQIISLCLILLSTSAMYAQTNSYNTDHAIALDPNSDREPSLEEALKHWPEMPQQVTFLGINSMASMP